MITDIVGKRYAEAIYNVAESEGEGKVLEIYKELETVMDLYEKDSEFKQMFTQPKIDVSKRKQIAVKVFEKQISALGLTIVTYLVDKDRLSIIKSIVKEYLKIYYVRCNYVDVEVTFAIEPTEEQKKRLIKTVEKKTGKKVNLKVLVDQKIIAGGVIKIGDQIIDGSLKRQFEKLKVSL